MNSRLMKSQSTNHPCTTYVVEAKKVTHLATLQCGRVFAVPEQVPARHQKLAANLWNDGKGEHE
jgi:hypothetical protein